MNIMVILKKHNKNKNNISADYYPEGRSEKGFMSMNLKSEEIVEHHNVSSFAAAHVKRELKRLAKIEDPPKEKQYYGIDINKYCQRKDLKEGVRMDNFTIIYKILKALEQAMDYDEFDVNKISHTRLNITYQRWEKS